MSGKVNLWNLGSQGVDLTKSAYHKDDGSLVAAQNAVPDLRGEAGALAKRDGLVAINSSALAGTVKGVVFVGLTLGGSGGGTERVYVALHNSGTGADLGWSMSTDSFVASTTVTTDPTPSEYSLGFYVTGAEEGSKAVTVNNKIYYAGNITEGAVPVIRVWDGVTDKEFARVPYNPDVSVTVPPVHIIAMIAVGSTIYFSTLDTISGSDKSSVYSLSTLTGVITKLGSTFSGAWVASLGWHLGRLWAGLKTDTADTEAVHFFRPTIDTTWTADETFTGHTSVEFLIDYEGSLFAGLRATGVNTAQIYKRTASNGSWASSKSAAGTGAARFNTATVFKGKLYVSYHRTTGLVIAVEQFDGTTWTQVYAATNIGGIDAPLIFSTKSTLYFFRGIDNDDVVVSTDGTTWSSARALSSGNSVITAAAIRV